MKKFFLLLTGLLLYLLTINNIYCQQAYLGVWQGIFMNDFNVEVEFSINSHKQLDGYIKMMNGANVIQNDKLSNIKLIDGEFSFYITDKSTPFKGNFNDDFTTLSGEFIFPDASRHAIELKRSLSKTNLADELELSNEKNFAPEDLKQDLSFLYSNLKKYHPDLYAYTTQDSIEALFSKLQTEIDDSISLKEFFCITSQLTNAIKCSHTGLKLPQSYQNLLDKYGNFFPFEIFFNNGKAFYISGDCKGNQQILAGNQIISINNQNIQKIIEQLFYFIPSEGCNETTKYYVLNKRFSNLFNLIDNSEVFNIKLNNGNYNIFINVPASNLEDLKLKSKPIETPNITFNHTNKMDVGILKVPSFGIQNMEQYFQKLDSIFNDLKTTKTQALIIDLRGNSGGHPIFAAQLLSYCTNKDFTYFKRNEDVKDFEPLYNKMQPNKLNFNGDIYVFVDGGCLSTTGHLISLLKNNTNAIFIGEEPGSTYRCNDFSIQLTLPKTGIELNVPRTTFETSVNGFSQCMPFPLDYEVSYSVSNVIAKEDVYMEVFREIRAK